jgi:alkylation response protein AidB-like acyl-CoA dehydrogenase
MDFEFSPEQEALRDSVRRFLADRAPIRPYVRAMLDDARGTTDDVWRGLADLGATGLLVPEEHGGAGMGMIDVGVVAEELGRAVHPGPFVSSAVAAAATIGALGSPDDHAALLPGLADGSTIGTLALHEPGRGARWRSPSTTARRVGTGWELEGTKAHVPDALAADLLLVTATAPDGLGVFVVDRRDADGARVEIDATATVDLTRKEATVALRAAPAHLLGTGDAAATMGALEDAIDRVTAALVADGVGAASAALDMTVAYAKERVQFERPIGSFQAVQHLCADMLQTLELGRAGAYYALWACDAADAAERHRAVTMAKAWASDGFARIGAGAIQVHGGIGFTWEHDIHLFAKRLLTLQQSYGTTADQLEELAGLVL